jgi:glycosyltransferase involved in cell wall biosynthesis
VSGPGVTDRVRQVRRLLRSEGYAGVQTRLRERAASRLAPADRDRIRVARGDLMRAAEAVSAGEAPAPPLEAHPGEPLRVAWVCIPPGKGSGGHTTMFRLVAALEQTGHECVVYLHDRHGWSLEQHRRTIRTWWPWVKADIRDAAEGIDDAHAVFATAWETAYVVLGSRARGARMYLVQDFEPWFYPAGSEALLAEATLRFGFHGVTAGRWLAELLRRDYRMPADHFDFGCDVDRYSLDDAANRSGVCFFARPSTPRRAFGLGMAALDLFAARHPEVDVHLYGEPAGRPPFKAIHHGLLTPEQLNELYNRCVAGLVLSATNVSLVPYEMLAAGCIPVVNDAEHNRVVLDNPEVVYAPATPFELANALNALVERPASERREAAYSAAASVRGTTWDQAGSTVEGIVRRVVAAAAHPQEPERAVRFSGT